MGADLGEILDTASRSGDPSLVKGAGHLLSAIHCGLPELTENAWAAIIRNGGVIYPVLGRAMRALIEDDQETQSFEMSQNWKAPAWCRAELDALVASELLPSNRSVRGQVAKTFVALRSSVAQLASLSGPTLMTRTNHTVDAFDAHQDALRELAVTDPVAAFRLGAPVEPLDLIDALPEQGGAVGLVDLACHTGEGLLVHILNRNEAEVEIRTMLAQAFTLDHAMNLSGVYEQYLLGREGDPEEALDYIATVLHDRLWCHVAKLAGDLGLSQLIVVPDAWTRSLPHHLARVCGKEVRTPPDVPIVARDRLVDLFPVEQAPTLQMVAINQWQLRPRRLERIAVLADPTGDLPGARMTARYLQRQIPEDPATKNAPTLTVAEGGEATTTAFSRALSTANMLVYAGHGEYPSGRDDDARLVLADGVWSAGSDVVVLSGSVQVLAACEAGAHRPGEEGGNADALPGRLLSGGSGAVLAAFWAVEDLSFAYLTERFLNFLAHPGYRPSAALFRAMNALKTWPRAEAAGVVRAMLAEIEMAGAEAQAEEYAHLAELLAWLEDTAPDPPFASPLYWGVGAVFGGGWNWPTGAFAGREAIKNEAARLRRLPKVPQALREHRYRDAGEAIEAELKTAHGPGRIDPLCQYAKLLLLTTRDRRAARYLLTRAMLLAEAHGLTEKRMAIARQLDTIGYEGEI